MFMGTPTLRIGFPVVENREIIEIEIVEMVGVGIQGA
jgi:hypothetical protein